MEFKEFLKKIRTASDRYIILDAEGTPEFVIMPFKKFSEEQEAKESIFSSKVSEIEKIAMPMERSMGDWDAMMGELGALGNAQAKEEAISDEPQFQFEPVDE